MLNRTNIYNFGSLLQDIFMQSRCTTLTPFGCSTTNTGVKWPKCSQRVREEEEMQKAVLFTRASFVKSFPIVNKLQTDEPSQWKRLDGRSVGWLVGVLYIFGFSSSRLRCCWWLFILGIRSKQVPADIIENCTF